MKKSILFSLALFFASFVFAQNEEPSEDDRIFWDEWFKLEWSDFKGDPHTNEGVAAQSSIGLPYNYVSDGEGILNVTVNVCFIKSESWSRSEKRNNVLLQHEQLHFDIAELHRRMIIKELLEAKFDKNNYKEVLEEIINRIWVKKYRVMQDKYDSETNFSRIIREQINWNRFVKQQLTNLEEYTYTELELSLINFD